MPPSVRQASNRSKIVTLRLRPHELRAIDVAARTAGQPRAEFIGSLVLQEIARRAVALNAGEAK